MGAKGTNTEGSEGIKSQRVKYFFGYKIHTSLNAENHLFTSVITTPGNVYDEHFLQADLYFAHL